MKKTITLFLLAGILIVSCRTSKKFQASVPEDKPLFDALNALAKKPENSKALFDLKILYPKSVERHEQAIDAYRQSADDDRWDRILWELNALQHIYNTLQTIPGSFSYVKPKNYVKDIELLKNDAASDFYNKGNELLEKGGRENALRAYATYVRAGKFIPGFKDLENQSKLAWEAATVDVVINPITDNTVYYAGMGMPGFPDFNYRPQEYQDALVRDLGGISASRLPARFYNDRDVRRSNIDADWELDISWQNINPMPTVPQQFNRQLSKSIEIGKDSAGRPTYQVVNATLYVTQQTYQARGSLQFRVTDITDHSLIDQGLLDEEVSWTESSATYTGDSRALSQEDWAMVNNRYFRNPSRGEVLNSLMRKIYPLLRRRVEEAVQPRS